MHGGVIDVHVFIGNMWKVLGYLLDHLTPQPTGFQNVGFIHRGDAGGALLGDLKEMERELGISYPTVRGRIDALVRALGLGEGAPAAEETESMVDAESADTEPALPDDPAGKRRDILERLARRELSAEDAAAALRGLGSQA